LFITQQDLANVLERHSLQEYGSASPPLSLNPDKNQVLIGERSIKLTSQQFEVMQLLYAAQGEIKSKDDIAFAAYKSTEGVTDQAIDSLAYRIRQKIERDPKNPQYLVTVRGAGYRLQNTG
jgi:DNA-binding response OmpR family regulator